MSAPLLHICTPSQWRKAARAGQVRPESLAAEGFVHLSTVEQVQLPANRLYPGRTDLVLLCVDPDKLEAELRWEPGVPGDPAAMRFPHLYGPLPLGAVVAVLDYRPDSSGRFHPPRGVAELGAR